MNANIRHLSIFFLVAFAIILADVTYWQVLDASAMYNRPDNPRLVLQAREVRRGLIYDRTGRVLAQRVTTNGYIHHYLTDPSLSQVIGYDSERYGTSELENSYNKYLTGQVAGNSWSSVIKRWEHKPAVGDNVTLTIDDQLQQDVNALLPNSPSAAVVADPRNGDILAMVSKPNFDANQVSDPTYWNSLLHNTDDPLINRVTSGYYPPGSTFKIVTLAAALNSGTMSLNTIFDGQRASGPLNVQGYIIPAFSSNLSDCGGRVVYPPITLETALVCSDDIVFAEVGLTIGANAFVGMAHDFGLDHVPPFAIPVVESHVRQTQTAMTPQLLAASAFGQGEIHVTPLQMLMATEAIADGGSIPYPNLVKQVTAPDGSVVQSESTGTLYRPISSSIAGQIKQAMIQVVETGSGILAQVPGVVVAGKTGTAETGDGEPPHAWFVAFAPADHPRVAVAVIIEHGGEGATVAAPIAQKILEDALALNP